MTITDLHDKTPQAIPQRKVIGTGTLEDIRLLFLRICEENGQTPEQAIEPLELLSPAYADMIYKFVKKEL